MIRLCLVLMLVLGFLGCGDSPVIQDIEDTVSLAPGIPPADVSTTVWAYWGGSTYHRETCRFIVSSKKVKELLYCFSVERGTKMGLKVCSSCFKAVK